MTTAIAMKRILLSKSRIRAKGLEKVTADVSHHSKKLEVDELIQNVLVNNTLCLSLAPHTIHLVHLSKQALLADSISSKSWCFLV